MGLFHEFRQFTVRGNAVDMGVGVVLGAAFSSFIESLVRDILLPPIGILNSKIDFENLYISLNGHTYPSLQAAKEAGAATINYGLFITTSVRFIIILFVVFLSTMPSVSMAGFKVTAFTSGFSTATLFAEAPASALPVTEDTSPNSLVTSSKYFCAASIWAGGVSLRSFAFVPNQSSFICWLPTYTIVSSPDLTFCTVRASRPDRKST